MEKLYKMTYHFNDGSSWGEETHDADQSSEGIKYILDHFRENPDSEIESQGSGEVRKTKDIKSIEIHL